MNQLEELKLRVDKHMKNELDIFESMFALDKADTEEFIVWYNNHPICKCIDEIKEIVDRRCKEADGRSKTQSNFRDRPICETEIC